METQGDMWLSVNGQPSATIHQGGVATFEVSPTRDDGDELLVDFEGSGEWETVEGHTFNRLYPLPGRFVVGVRRGEHCAAANLRVLRVTGTGGSGLF